MNNKTTTIPKKMGRPAAKITWPKGRFTAKTILNTRNGRNASVLTTAVGIRARLVKAVENEEIYLCGTKERKKGETGRPQFLYSTNPEDVPAELRTPKINGAIRRMKNAAKRNEAKNGQAAAAA